MLGIGAAFLGGNVTMIEIDKDAYEILKIMWPKQIMRSD